MQVLALGYSVGRVEEMAAGAARGAAGVSSSSKLLVRQLVRIYTPGTAVEGLLLDDQVGPHWARSQPGPGFFGDGSPSV